MTQPIAENAAPFIHYVEGFLSLEEIPGKPAVTDPKMGGAIIKAATPPRFKVKRYESGNGVSGATVYGNILSLKDPSTVPGLLEATETPRGQHVRAGFILVQMNDGTQRPRLIDVHPTDSGEQFVGNMQAGALYISTERATSGNEFATVGVLDEHGVEHRIGNTFDPLTIDAATNLPLFTPVVVESAQQAGTTFSEVCAVMPKPEPADAAAGADVADMLEAATDTADEAAALELAE